MADDRSWPSGPVEDDGTVGIDVATEERSLKVEAAAAPPRRHVLVISTQTGAAFAYPWLEDRPLTVGRGTGVDLRIADCAVSRLHVRLEVLAPDRFRIADLGSVNGTRVGSERLFKGVAEVGPGDPIVVGRTKLFIETFSEPERDEADSLSPDWLLAPAASLCPAMRQLDGQIARVAPTLDNVLLQGETGAGKDGLAKLIHARSTRARRGFMRLNCATFSAELLESQLFGHVKGAFTSAVRDNRGLLVDASGGTVFLDEIGELAPNVQAKLLVVLEERAVRRVGGHRLEPVDVRFIAATNRNLVEEVRCGRFREDLFYRLTKVPIQVPPLRDRMSDLPVMVAQFIALRCKELNRQRTPVLAPSAMERLRRHPWPGNVRELKTVVDRSVLFLDGHTLHAEDLVFDQAAAPGPQRLPATAPAAGERELIQAALEKAFWNRKKAAELLGMARGTLQKRMKQYGIPRPYSP